MNRSDFILLKEQVYGRPLIYFDNAATTQKPESVINAISDYYRGLNSNIHRGVHYLSQKATEEFEVVRRKVQKFINAAHPYEIIFTRGATESINLVASSFGKAFLEEGDNVIITEMEHHANIVPWQMICEEKKAKLKILPFNEQGVLETHLLEGMIDAGTKIISVAHISNTLGTVNPVEQIIETAHKHGVPVMVDGAQAVSHEKVDVTAMDCDFYCFSSHKMYGPMGIGILYGKEEWLNRIPPYQGGGEMIREVTFEKTVYNELPFKFEAGTPSVGDAIGLMKAIEYIENIGMDVIADYEHLLLEYATERLMDLGDITIIGNAPRKAAIVSFLVNNVHPYDAGVIMDRFGVAVRTGHHCTQPIMDKLGIPGTIRASFALYNTCEEIDVMMESLVKVKSMFL